MRLVIVLIGGGRIRRGRSGCCAGIQAVMLHIWITSLYLNIVCFHLHEGAAASDTAAGLPNISGYVRPPAGHNAIPVQMLAGLAQATEPDQVCGFMLIHSLWVLGKAMWITSKSYTYLCTWPSLFTFWVCDFITVFLVGLGEAMSMVPDLELAVNSK